MCGQQIARKNQWIMTCNSRKALEKSAKHKWKVNALATEMRMAKVQNYSYEEMYDFMRERKGKR